MASPVRPSRSARRQEKMTVDPDGCAGPSLDRIATVSMTGPKMARQPQREVPWKQVPHAPLGGSSPKGPLRSRAAARAMVTGQVEAGRIAADLRRGPWELRGLPGPDLRTLRIDPGPADVLWVVGANEVLRSGDGGGQWTTELEGSELAPASVSVGPDGAVLIGRGLAVTAKNGGVVTHIHRADGGGGAGAPAGPWREVGTLNLAPRSSRDRLHLVRESTAPTRYGSRNRRCPGTAAIARTCECSVPTRRARMRSRQASPEVTPGPWWWIPPGVGSISSWA